jgi:subtilisin family serine protease
VSEAGRDVFEQVFALLSPERILGNPNATGDGVRVAVVDTGIERSILEEKFRARGVEIRPIEGGVFREDRPEPAPYDGHQSSPHGTTVADVLLTLAPRAQLYSADVFGPLGSCDVRVVIRAIRWAIDQWGCKVINLSLGVPEHRLQQVQRRQELLRTVEEAYYRDVLIIAAAHNEHPFTRSYPAAFAPPLLSVDKGVFADPLEFAYHLKEQVEFQAHSQGYLGPFAAEPATSWAAPHLSAIAARVLSLRPGLKPFEMKAILYWMFQARSRASARDGGQGGDGAGTEGPPPASSSG